jgi:dipeptidase
VKGDYKTFEWDSAWWVWNLVSNLCYDRWSRIAPDVQAAQARREADLLKMQPVIEEAAVKLGSSDEPLMREFLTNYSVSTGESVFRYWQGVAGSILVKHVDGYVKNAQGRGRGVGYSAEWLKRVVADRPEQFRVRMKTNETDH